MMTAIPSPRGHKTLPRYICEYPDRFTIRIRRGASVRRAQVSKSHAQPLAEALRIRDAMAAAAGPPQFREHRASPTRPRSNTGIVGVSETIKWVHYRPRYCFRVGLARPGLPTAKCVYYGKTRTRAQALKQAIRLRKLVA